MEQEAPVGESSWAYFYPDYDEGCGCIKDEEGSPLARRCKGHGSSQLKQAEVNSIQVEEMLKKVQEERCAIEATERRLIKVKEEERQERNNRKEFLGANPPEFRGVMDPYVVYEWIGDMENIFNLCYCPEDCKALYASFMLRGQALYWWNTIIKTRGKETVKTMLWDEFKELVCKTYSPKCLIHKLEKDFINLKQGNMSVLEYMNMFIKKTRFAGTHVATTEKMITRFLGGLETKIRSFMANPKTLEEAIEQALLNE